MKLNTLKARGMLFLFALMISSFLQAQEYKNLTYDCLDTTFFLNQPSVSSTHLNCIDGVARLDTVNPCTDFYEEEKIRFRPWYLYGPDQGTATEIFFGELDLHEDSYFGAEPTKYFEFKQSGIWFVMSRFPGGISRVSVRIADLSGGGVNLGINKVGDRPDYFDSFASIPADYFEDFYVEYKEGRLTIEGAIENLQITGDHLYLANVELNAMTTAVAEAEIQLIKAYPNPLTDQLILKGKSLDKSWLSLTDSSGRTLYRKTVEGTEQIIDFSPYNPGLYFITAQKAGQMIFVEKIQKN